MPAAPWSSKVTGSHCRSARRRDGLLSTPAGRTGTRRHTLPPCSRALAAIANTLTRPGARELGIASQAIADLWLIAPTSAVRRILRLGMIHQVLLSVPRPSNHRRISLAPTGLSSAAWSRIRAASNSLGLMGSACRRLGLREVWCR